MLGLGYTIQKTFSFPLLRREVAVLQRAAETLYYTPGPCFRKAVGLAASQIGYHKRFLIMANISDIDSGQLKATQNKQNQDRVMSELLGSQMPNLPPVPAGDSPPTDIMWLEHDKDEDMFVFMLNPKVVTLAHKTDTKEEGCLSEQQ